MIMLCSSPFPPIFNFPRKQEISWVWIVFVSPSQLSSPYSINKGLRLVLVDRPGLAGGLCSRASHVPVASH